MSEANGLSKEIKTAPGRLTMQQGYFMKTASIVGIILMVLGSFRSHTLRHLRDS